MVDKSEKFSWFVRLGYAARGLLYIVIGYLALSSSGHDKSQRGAMDYVRDTMPGGTALLYLTAAGLLGYALYKLCSLLFDVEHHGGDAKGLAVRVAQGGTGLIYAALAWSAFKLAQGSSQAAAGGGGVRRATGTLLSFGVGPLVLGLIGLGFFVAAGAQLRQAATARFMRRISSQAPQGTEAVGRAGHAARAIVFAVVGWSLVHSAWIERRPDVQSLGDAIDSLAGNGLLYTIVAIGLVLFGLFSMTVGYYRIIPDLDRQDLKPRLR
jgi:hypothetical protein